MSLTDLTNLGPTIVDRLHDIGIVDRDDLESVGSVEAYTKLSAEAGRPLPVCYYLYALEGALQGRNWRALSDGEKRRLRDALDR